MALPEREPIVVAGGEVADIQGDAGKRLHLHRLALRKEAVGNAALVQISMVRECRPPERELSISWVARRSTIATSTPASASSAPNIIPVGPPPAITTAWSVIAEPRPRRVRCSR